MKIFCEGLRGVLHAFGRAGEQTTGLVARSARVVNDWLVIGQIALPY